MKYAAIILLLSSLISSGFAQKEPTNNAISQRLMSPRTMGYHLVWVDQFNGNSLDTTKWNVRGIGPRRIGYNSAEAVKVEDGFLKLYALKKGDSILAGAVGTAKHVNQKYGYFECRAQLQKSAGIWGAFWIQSSKISQGEDPAKFGSEMDIFEYFSEMGNDTITHAVHWAYGPNMHSVGPMKSYLKGLSQGFHIYGFEWTQDKYAFYIDGYKFHEMTQGISNIEEYMILSMELPGELKNLEKTVFPDVFIVDWVKVYLKP